MKPIRVLIVDDSAVIRRLLTSVMSEDPAIEVIGTAIDGAVGLKKIEELRPDLVTLDVEMPNLNGLETLQAIRKKDRRLPVIMFSTLTEKGASATIEALGIGASDYVTKPSNTGSMGLAMERVRDELVPKIKALCRRGPSSPVVAAEPRRSGPPDRYEVLAIGSSTGGPNALQQVLQALPADFPLPILITQHMPALFTKQLATRLNSLCKIGVEEAQNGSTLRPGVALVAPGDFHMTVARSGAQLAVKLSSAPPENFCRPSVDVMLRSIHGQFRGNVLMTMLTGMGHDGAAGTKQLRESGAWIIAQDEASSVVWGMPGAVVSAGQADEVVPLDAIGATIVRHAAGGGRAGLSARAASGAARPAPARSFGTAARATATPTTRPAAATPAAARAATTPAVPAWRRPVSPPPTTRR